VVTVFRSRLRPGSEADYELLAARMDDLARSQPGFVDFKMFVAEDGERVSIVRFADRTSHEAWRRHPEHRAAQAEGRRHLYRQYSILVGEVTAERSYDTAG
jgi:heme-degrading monooxygenase HmoA